MRFLVNREAATQFDEVEIDHQPLPVRLVCLVGQRGTDGILPVRVARLDFIGRGNRIVRTIPSRAAADDDLAALNRDPGKFAGKTIDVKAVAVPITEEVRDSKELLVLFPNHAPTRNLAFTISNSMKKKMVEVLGGESLLNMAFRVRLTGVVPETAAPPGGRTVITLTKIEILSKKGESVLTIE
jgi:hypothetical protein